MTPTNLPKRLDPPDCGCTDCLTGYSKPIDVATRYEMMCAAPEFQLIQNASGQEILLRTEVYVDGVQILSDR